MQEHQIDIPSQLKLWAETLGVEESHIVASSGEFLYKQWREDLENSKYGYPLQPVAQSAYLEDSLGKIIGNFEYKKRTPAIFLTHDVDYLNPTYILWLKKAIGRKKFSLDCFKDNNGTNLLK
ncbi:MAG: hypothetical protein A2451_03620 [Bdellovibrionales bacterium RIFOXYC2_FULL_39_8]|nr:MAG: hypothetical protein A2451_03620 [Bdellovibrionales bacterium RIFOXYC2_FULL_39_8]